MGLYYPQQHIKTLIGSKNSTSFEIIPAELTNNYEDNESIITTDYHPQMMIYGQYTVGSGGGGNSIQLKLEFSSDGVNFYQETVESPVAGSTDMFAQERSFDNNGSSVALTTYNIRIPVPIADKYFKFSVKETVVGGSAGIFYSEALISGK